MPGVEISRGRRPPEDDGMRPMARAALGAQLLAMIVLLAAPGSLAAASSRSLQHQAEAVVPLRTHVDGYTLIRSDPLRKGRV